MVLFNFLEMKMEYDPPAPSDEMSEVTVHSHGPHESSSPPGGNFGEASVADGEKEKCCPKLVTFLIGVLVFAVGFSVITFAEFFLQRASSGLLNLVESDEGKIDAYKALD